MRFKKLILILLLVLASTVPAFAEKISVKIAPAQIISTNLDEIEVGDRINFEAVNDVYINSKLYISKGSKIVGVVDFVHNNGWGGDSAEIVFKNFYTTDVNDNKVIISYPLVIDGKEEMASNVREVANKGLVAVGPRVVTRFVRPFRFLHYQYLSYVGFAIRGAEINVEPDTQIYNLFIGH